MIKINPTVFGGDSGDFGDSPPVLCFGVPSVVEKVGTVGTMCCDYQLCPRCLLRFYMGGVARPLFLCVWIGPLGMFFNQFQQFEGIVVLQRYRHLKCANRSDANGEHDRIGGYVIHNDGVFLLRVSSQHINDPLTPWFGDVRFWNNSLNAINLNFSVRFAVFFLGFEGESASIWFHDPPVTHGDGTRGGRFS